MTPCSRRRGGGEAGKLQICVGETLMVATWEVVTSGDMCRHQLLEEAPKKWAATAIGVGDEGLLPILGGRG